MQIIEQFILGKYDDAEKCEDFIHISDHFIAVIDGVTSYHTGTLPKPGRVIALTIENALHDIPPQSNMADTVKSINASVRHTFGYASNDAVRAIGIRPAASAVIYSKHHQELWCLGDILIRVDGKSVDTHKKIDDITTAMRCSAVKGLLQLGRSENDLLESMEDRSFIQPLLDIQQPAFMNNSDDKELGYPNIDGDDRAVEVARVINVKNARHITLATDGYPVLGKDLSESEVVLAEALDNDPLMYRLYPQVKGVQVVNGKKSISFDDRAYISFTCG